MSKIDLYEGLKADLQAVQGVRADNSAIRFKTVELWRNLLQMEKVENPRLFPACFIEFLPSNYMELAGGLQSYDMTVRLHICFESYKDEDTDVLRLVDATFRAVQGKQYGFFGVLKRRNEEEDFNHENVQDYIQDYSAGKCKDFGADNRPTTEATVAEIIINTEILP